MSKPAIEASDVPEVALRPALEAVLMVADQPLDDTTLASAVGRPVHEVRDTLAALQAEYTAQDRGFDLRNVGGGWRYYTREQYAAVVEKFVLDGQQTRLTQAALETLAVVAYKQPVSRARVSAVRGVNVDGVMRTLLTRGLVEEAGTDVSTGAHLYRTSNYFLERIGITSLDDLPEIAPFLPEMDEIDDVIEVPRRQLDRPDHDDEGVSGENSGAPSTAALAPSTETSSTETTSAATNNEGTGPE